MRPWNTYVMKEPDWGSIRTKDGPPSPLSLLHPSRMERSGLESQVGPGAAGVDRTRCVLWIRGKV